MGLDQFGKIRNPQTGEVKEIAYWRKHNALHGWMEALWHVKKRPNANALDPFSFNCIPLPLTRKDLINLAADCYLGRLPKTQGFFFGPDSRDRKEYFDAETREFVEFGLDAIDKGWEVAYDSWW